MSRNGLGKALLYNIMKNTSLDKENIFEGLLNRYVKVIYGDGGKTSIARGVLKSENNDFLFLKGDYTEIIINKNSVKKISRQVKEGKNHDNF